jgi:hypothetical protein
VNIELLVVPDCPHAGPAAELLRRALVSIGLDGTAFTTRVISDAREAEAAGFTGSPSFMIDGRDLFAEPGRTPFRGLAPPAADLPPRGILPTTGLSKHQHGRKP